MALADELSAALERGAEQGSWVSARAALEPIDPEPYFERGIRRRDVADLFLAIASHPPERIRSVAVAAYAKSFGAPLPTVAGRTTRDNPAWRH